MYSRLQFTIDVESYVGQNNTTQVGVNTTEIATTGSTNAPITTEGPTSAICTCGKDPTTTEGPTYTCICSATTEADIITEGSASNICACGEDPITTEGPTSAICICSATTEADISTEGSASTICTCGKDPITTEGPTSNTMKPTGLTDAQLVGIVAGSVGGVLFLIMLIIAIVLM